MASVDVEGISNVDVPELKPKGELDNSQSYDRTESNTQHETDSNVVNIAKDGSVKKTILEHGDAESATPPPLSLTSLHIKGTLQSNGYVFLDSTVEEYECHLGRAESARGLEMAVATMHLNEHAIVECTSEYGFTKHRRPDDVPEDADLRFEVRLVRFNTDKNTWDISDKEKVERVSIKRTLGNEQYTLGRYATALRSYNRAIAAVRSIDNGERSHIVPVVSRLQQKQMLLPLFLNSAACNLKLEKYHDVVGNCSEAMQVPGESNNFKALFRRAQAFRHLMEYDRAIRDLKQCQDNGHNTSVVRSELALVKRLSRASDRAEYRRFSGFFEGHGDNDEHLLYADKPDVKPFSVWNAFGAAITDISKYVAGITTSLSNRIRGWCSRRPTDAKQE